MATAPPYFSYFQNAFLTLDISRPNFRGLAQYTLDAVRQALTAGRFGPDHESLAAKLADNLETAISKFDTSLGQRNDPTAGDTEAFRQARQQWLDFVQAQQLQVVNPALFGKPALKDFRGLTHGKLGRLGQETLLTRSAALVVLYQTHAAALQPLYALHNAGQPPLADRAAALVQTMRAVQQMRNQELAEIDASIQLLAADWVAVALALRRIKGLLEMVFDTDHEVYVFFDFSKARSPKAVRKADRRAATAPNALPIE